MQTAGDFFRPIVSDDLQIGFLLLCAIQPSASVNFSLDIKEGLIIHETFIHQNSREEKWSA